MRLTGAPRFAALWVGAALSLSVAAAQGAEGALLAEARRAEREGEPAAEHAACLALLDLGPSAPCAQRLAFLERRQGADGGWDGLTLLRRAQRGGADRAAVEALIADPATPPDLGSDARAWLQPPLPAGPSWLHRHGGALGWALTGLHAAVGLSRGRHSRGWRPDGLLPLLLIGGAGLVIAALYEPGSLDWAPSLLGRLTLVHLAAAAGAAPLRAASRARQACWSAASALATLAAALPALVQVGWLV